MKFQQLLTGLALSASLFLTSPVSTANAQATTKVKPGLAVLPPSVVGGKATTIAVYNYTGKTLAPFWVDPTGAVQPVPNGQPVPPITGNTPVQFPTFVGATLGFRPIPTGGGGGKWVHLTGARVKPYMILGTPPKGFTPPEAAANADARENRRSKNNRGSNAKALKDDPTGDFNADSFAPSRGGTAVAANNSAPGGDQSSTARGRRRGRNAPEINITVVPVEPAIFPAASSTTAPLPSAAQAASPETDTKAKTEPTAKKRFTAESPVIVEFLRIHNAARADVGAAPLEWSSDLANSAHEWAAHIARTGRLEHRPNAKYGENIATGKGDDFTPAAAANAWLSEKANFTPSSDEPPVYRITKMSKNKNGETEVHEHDGATAHYTQMVWKKSTMVGVGTARSKNGTLIVVACYNPRGNIQGEQPY